MGGVRSRRAQKDCFYSESRGEMQEALEQRHNVTWVVTDHPGALWEMDHTETRKKALQPTRREMMVVQTGVIVAAVGRRGKAVFLL